MDIEPNLGLRVFLPQVVPGSLTVNEEPECSAVEKGSFLAGCSASALLRRSKQGVGRPCSLASGTISLVGWMDGRTVGRIHG